MKKDNMKKLMKAYMILCTIIVTALALALAAILTIHTWKIISTASVIFTTCYMYFKLKNLLNKKTTKKEEKAE